MNRENLYMLALMPPAELARDIERIRSEFAEKYLCSAALKPPVHITLLPPYKAGSETEEALVARLEEWGRTQIPFPVTLENYGSFPRNGVVFISVSRNELLDLFQKDLKKEFLHVVPDLKVKNYAFSHPHITIGYRDIPPQVFSEAENEYLSKSFFATFVADRFYLWKHNTLHWEILHGFGIGNKPVNDK